MSNPSDRWLRFTAAVVAGLGALALTAPWSGVIRCADGLITSTCTDTATTLLGGEAWGLLPSLLLAVLVAVMVAVLVGIGRRMAMSGRSQRAAAQAMQLDHDGDLTWDGDTVNPRALDRD